MKIGTGLV